MQVRKGKKKKEETLEGCVGKRQETGNAPLHLGGNLEPEKGRKGKRLEKRRNSESTSQTNKNIAGKRDLRWRRYSWGFPLRHCSSKQ